MSIHKQRIVVKKAKCDVVRKGVTSIYLDRNWASNNAFDPWSLDICEICQICIICQGG